MSECIFCKIVNNEIPSSIIYEDSNILVFLDISPQETGHVLVIPKVHSDNFLEMENSLAEKMFGKTQIVAKKIKEALSAEGVNILMNIGSSAGQLVFHTHIHIIPRKGKKSFESVKDTAKYLKEKLSNLV